MISSDELLRQAANDGSLNVEHWPQALEAVLARLDHIVYNEFPVPSIPRPTPRPPLDLDSSPPHYDGYGPKASSTGSNHATPGSSRSGSPLPSAPPQPISDIPETTITDLPEGTIPPPLRASLTYVKSCLQTNFDQNPPHTIQRLAELILHPKRHYRYLPAYLNALDRVVAVSSGTNIFPLPTSEVSSTNPLLVNGNAGATPIIPNAGLGSDESLGGALLTPILWLKPGHRSASFSTNGTSSNSTDLLHENTESDTIMTDVESSSSNNSALSMREQGAVTQGELLRQEQESNGPPAAVASAQNHSHVVLQTNHGTGTAIDQQQPTVEAPTTGEVGTGSGEVQAQSPQQPHARGPENIGMEDTGRQDRGHGGTQYLDMEAAVGRSASSPASSPPQPSLLQEPGAAPLSPPSPSVSTAFNAQQNAETKGNEAQDGGLENLKQSPVVADRSDEGIIQDVVNDTASAAPSTPPQKEEQSTEKWYPGYDSEKNPGALPVSNSPPEKWYPGSVFERRPVMPPRVEGEVSGEEQDDDGDGDEDKKAGT